MPLSKNLDRVLLGYACPHCGQMHMKMGSWFRTVGRYRCLQCNGEVPITYDAKLRLFAEYEREKAKPH